MGKTPSGTWKASIESQRFDFTRSAGATAETYSTVRKGPIEDNFDKSGLRNWFVAIGHCLFNLWSYSESCDRRWSTPRT